MTAIAPVTLLAVASALVAWLYFRRYELARPPVGVFTTADLALMLAMVVGVPFAYLALPPWLVGAVFCLLALNLAWFALEPVLVRRASVWLAAVGIVGANAAVTIVSGAGSWPSFVLNDVELMLLAAVAANMLVQIGMRARHLALLAGALTVYDIAATSETRLMTQLLARLASLPFAPLVVWRAGDDFLGMGLGDVLLMALAPLVLRKAFGRTAGVLALGVSSLTVAGLLVLVVTGVSSRAFPAIAALGPLVVAQVLVWRLRRGRERTTAEYLAQEPAPERVTRALVLEGR